MNAQANLLKSNGILNTTITEVENFLIKNSKHKYSTSEIYTNMPVWIKSQIQAIASSYTKGGCSSAASYIGVVASMISKRRTDFLHEYHHYCPILKRYDDAFEKV